MTDETRDEREGFFEVGGDDYGAQMQCQLIDHELRVKLSGNLDIATTPPLRQSLNEQFLDNGDLDIQSVVLDLQDVEFLDSTALATLLQLREAMSKRGVSLRLRTTLSVAAKRVMEIAGVDRIFEYVEDNGIGLSGLTPTS